MIDRIKVRVKVRVRVNVKVKIRVNLQNSIFIRNYLNKCLKIKKEIENLFHFFAFSDSLKKVNQ